MIKNQDSYDLIKNLNDLLEKLKVNYDIIAPIARKGIRVLELSEHAESLFQEERVLYSSALNLHAEELERKKIVLYDESVRTGKTLARDKKELRKLPILFRKIHTATSLLHFDVKHRPDISPEYKVRDNYYTILLEEYVSRILSSGKPLDVDHLNILLELPNADDFLDFLREKYGLVELEHSTHFNGVEMYTIDFSDRDDFWIPHIEGHPRLFDEGPKKIRLYLKENLLRCVSIVYPALDISDNFETIQNFCKLKKNYKNGRFCNVLKPEKFIYNKHPKLLVTLCYNCIVYELSCHLIGSFLRELRNNNVDFTYKGLEEHTMVAMFHSEGKELAKYIKNRLRKFLNEEEVPRLPKERAAKCELAKIYPKKKEYFSDLQDVTQLSLAISEYKKVNRNLLRYETDSYLENINPDEEKNGFNPHLGLSYYQIREMMTKLNEKLKFSEAMDVALDIGLLKPFIPPKGIEVKCREKSYRAIVRLYRVVGENVEKSLKFFESLISEEFKGF
ncbi:MAG: hypothetical protein ACFFBD_09920 [Candidatus Hodarchaeota archaeon]